MKTLQNVLIIGLIVTHYVLVGADAFAQAAITPVALSAPPASLAMYQGDYVYNSAPFWQITNLVALLFLVGALVLNWRGSRRLLLLVYLVGFILISVVSLGYIFPEYTALISSPFSETVDPALVERGVNWRIMAFSRLVLFTLLGLLPLFALSKPTGDSTD